MSRGVSPAEAVIQAMRALSRRAEGHRLRVLAVTLASAIKRETLVQAIELVDSGQVELDSLECYESMVGVITKARKGDHVEGR